MSCNGRFVNHACDPNCESVIESSRVFIDAIRTRPHACLSRSA
jgi:SET domain-containing protein